MRGARTGVEKIAIKCGASDRKDCPLGKIGACATVSRKRPEDCQIVNI